MSSGASLASVGTTGGGGGAGGVASESPDSSEVDSQVLHQHLREARDERDKISAKYDQVRTDRHYVRRTPSNLATLGTQSECPD